MHTIPEIKTFLHSQPEDAKRWLGNQRKRRTRGQTSGETTTSDDFQVPWYQATVGLGRVRGVDDKRKQILEEAAEFDRIWGVSEAEEEPTNVPGRGIRQSSWSREDMRNHVEVHASNRERDWGTPSVSLIEKNPEVIPDVDIAAQVGRGLFLDEKIPRHEVGQGYVQVVEHSIMWKEKTDSKIFTYQGFTTCTEVDKSLTSAANEKGTHTKEGSSTWGKISSAER